MSPSNLLRLAAVFIWSMLVEVLALLLAYNNFSRLSVRTICLLLLYNVLYVLFFLCLSNSYFSSVPLLLGREGCNVFPKLLSTLSD